MMKNFFIFLVIAPLNLLAQSPLMATDKTSAYAFLNIYDLNGRLIPSSNEQTYAEGFPYVTEFFNKGIVQFSNGVQSANLFINYNLFDNTLRFRKDSNEYIMMDAVTGFTLRDANALNYQFKNNFPAIGKKTSATFYQVLTNGTNIQLLKYSYKKIASVYHYGMNETKQIDCNNEYYVYDIANAKLVNIEKSINSIVKALPAYEKAIDKYISENGANIKKEEQLIKLIQNVGGASLNK